MKIVFVVLGVLSLLAGCKSGGSSTPTALPSSKDSYFETKKDGETYVFHTVESMNAFRAGNPPTMKTKKYATPKPNVAHYEYTDLTTFNRLQDEYMKSHSVKY